MPSAKKQRLEANKPKVDRYLEDKLYTFAETVEMDGGMEFLEHLISEGIADSFAGAEYVKEREFIPNYEVFPMIYMMNILSGEWSVRRTQAILKDEAMLRIMGFKAEELANGLTGRGKKNQHGEGFERKSGIMASTTVIDNLACFSFEGLVGCFNGYISRAASAGAADFGEDYIIDSTIVETGEGYPGAKPVRREGEDGEPGEVVWGFKVFLLSSTKTRTPVALHITTANEADSPMLEKLVAQGVSNLGEGIIKTVLADRGFIDGRQLYRIKYEMGIDFIMPAKKNMDIWACMVGLRNDSKGIVEEWEYGKKGLSGGYLAKGSVAYSQYAPEPIGSKKDESGSPLDAVVVTRWAGKEIAPGKEKVILTSKEAESAIEVIQGYGQRSLIENCNFRELKQAAALNALPQYKNKNAEKTAYIHMLLCIFTLAVFTVMVEQAFSKTQENESMPKNIREFRFARRCEKGKIFILVEHYYYIYEMDEFMARVGFGKTSPG